MREPWLSDIAEQIDPFHSASERGKAHSQCWRKTRYYTEAQALREVRLAEKRIAKHEEQGRPIHHYRCNYESSGVHWHIGHVGLKHDQGDDQ